MRQIMRQIRQLSATLTLLVVYVGLGVPVALIGIPWTALRKDVSWFYRAAMWVVRTGTRAAGIQVRVTGREHVPAGRSCIFLANHVSNLDPPVLIPVLPFRTTVLLKQELMNIPLLGTAMKQGDFIPVERGSRRESAQASVAAAAHNVQRGLHIMIFPEGTRSLDGRLARFKKGPFFLAEQTGALVIPVALTGTERMMQKGSVLIHPGVATVAMLQAIDPADYGTREELMSAVHQAIAAALPDAMKPLAAGEAAT